MLLASSGKLSWRYRRYFVFLKTFAQNGLKALSYLSIAKFYSVGIQRKGLYFSETILTKNVKLKIDLTLIKPHSFCV